MAIAAPGRPAALLDGLDHLSAASPTCRRTVCPVLLAAAKTALLDARQPSFGAATKGFAEIGRLRGMLDVSPYAAALDAAFPPRGASA